MSTLKDFDLRDEFRLVLGVECWPRSQSQQRQYFDINVNVGHFFHLDLDNFDFILDIEHRRQSQLCILTLIWTFIF